MLFHHPGHGQIQPQQQGLGQGDSGQNAEGTAPAPGIRDQSAYRDTKHRRTDNTETDFGNRPPGVIRADDIHCRFTGQRPEHRQAQCRQQPGKSHHPDIGRQRRHGIGKSEHQQNRDKQALALKARAPGGQERAKGRNREREQGHQQTGLGHADLKVAGNRRQQADDHKLGGEHGKAGRRQQQDGQQHE